MRLGLRRCRLRRKLIQWRSIRKTRVIDSALFEASYVVYALTCRTYLDRTLYWWSDNNVSSINNIYCKNMYCIYMRKLLYGLSLSKVKSYECCNSLFVFFFRNSIFLQRYSLHFTVTPLPRTCYFLLQTSFKQKFLKIQSKMADVKRNLRKQKKVKSISNQDKEKVLLWTANMCIRITIIGLKSLPVFVLGMHACYVCLQQNVHSSQKT